MKDESLWKNPYFSKIKDPLYPTLKSQDLVIWVDYFLRWHDASSDLTGCEYLPIKKASKPLPKKSATVISLEGSMSMESPIERPC
jgi:hypothetical protein